MGNSKGNGKANGTKLYRRVTALKPNETVKDSEVPGMRYVARKLADGAVQQYAQLRYKHPVTDKWATVGIGRVPRPAEVEAWMEADYAESMALARDGETYKQAPLDSFAFGDLRTEARKQVGMVHKGIDPKAAHGVEGITLDQAIEEHIAAPRRKPLADSSIEQYRKWKRLYLSEHLKTPLRRLDQTTLVALLDKITKEHGFGVARMAGRLLRAVWRTARFTDQRLPPFPDMRRGALASSPPVKSRVTAHKLPILFTEMAKVKSIRKDAWVFILMTNLRETDTRIVRRDEIDLEAAVLHRPAPKGGEERAFDVPLSREALALAERVLRSHNSPWLFPSPQSPDKPIGSIDPKPKEFSLVWSPQDLRRIYSTVCAELNSKLVADALTNHRDPTGSVLAGYVSFDVDALREGQQRVTDWLVAKGLPL